MRQFKDEYIWIIGASSGIGKALAIELDNRGAILALSARNMDKLKNIPLNLTSGHTFHSLDVSKPETIEKAMAEMSRIPDRVIYMAGCYEPMKISSLDLIKTKNIIDTNFTGAINITALIMPQFLKRKSGQLAITASVAGYRGLPNAQPYGATKAALINFTESLFIESRGSGLDIKVINPGFVRTQMTAKNKFIMPMIIEADEAARCIADKLNSSSFEIHFPRRFSWFMKLIKFLPLKLFSGIIPR